MNKKYLSLLAPVVWGVLVSPVSAFEEGDWLVRVGATVTDPREDSEAVKLNGAALDAGIGLNSDTQLGINIEYFLNSSWGVELLAATPFEHRASATGALSGLDLADFKHLPPTLSAVYHAKPMGGVQPYVGLGLNYTLLFDEKLTPEAKAAFSGMGLDNGKLKLDNSLGVSVQVGADLALDERWSLNASVRWIDLETDAEIRFSSGDKLTSTIDVDPFVYTLSLAYKL